LEIQEAFGAVARKFHGGEYQRAAQECDRVIDEHRNDADIRVRAKRLQALLPNFGRNFEDGHSKYKQGQLANSVRPLRKARELYAEIGFPGALGPRSTKNSPRRRSPLGVIRSPEATWRARRSTSEMRLCSTQPTREPGRGWTR